MRSTLNHGPYEGQDLFDVNGERVGVIEDLLVFGRHVSAFRVRTDEGRTLDVPRDLFATTLRGGIQVRRPRDVLERGE